MKQWIEANMERQIQDLQRLVRIPSVSRGEPEPGMPLGRNVHDALSCALEIANELGFPQTRSLDGYCGVVDYGEGEEMLCVMTHLDVVPAGSGWSVEPFAGTIQDGRILGRGVLDDKGAAVSSLYALAAFKAAGIPTRRRIRLFFGCDEEMGWKCIERYKKTEPEPDVAFSPDGDYPLVNSEMGICQTTFVKKLQSRVRIDCGSAANVIPGEAECTLPFEAVPCADAGAVQLSFEGNVIRARGRGGHAANPQHADNALQGLLHALCAQPLDADDLATASGLCALLDFDRHGEGFGLDVTDESGRLTLSPDVLKWDGEQVLLTLDCRHPFSVSAEKLLATLDETMGALGFARTATRAEPGHFISPDSELVRTLLSVYGEESGSKSGPLSIGGGTYARAFKNAVAFGVDLEGAVSQCHMPDESVALSELRFNTVVMAEAMRRLAGK